MRKIIMLDTESTGLRDWDVAVEIAWWDLGSGERGCFYPPITADDLERAEPEALEINRYYVRGLDQVPQDTEGVELARLHQLLAGNIVAGSNPRFDMIRLNLAFERQWPDEDVRDPWYHHPIELGNYVAGVLRLPVSAAALSQSRCCELLGVQPGDHTAGEDVTAGGMCLLEAQRRALGRPALF